MQQSVHCASNPGAALALGQGSTAPLPHPARCPATPAADADDEGDEEEEGDDDEVADDEEEEEEPAKAPPKKMKKVKREDWEKLNDNKAIWLRKSSEVTKEEYEKFYTAISKVRSWRWGSQMSAEC